MIDEKKSLNRIEPEKENNAPWKKDLEELEQRLLNKIQELDAKIHLFGSIF